MQSYQLRLSLLYRQGLHLVAPSCSYSSPEGTNQTLRRLNTSSAALTGSLTHQEMEDEG